MGELEVLLADGTQEGLVRYVTSVNVCCNAHAGSRDLAMRTLEMSRGLRIGAHPGYPDREHFGRTVLDMCYSSLVDCILGQLEWLGERAAEVGIRELTHVKAHGALYNAAVRDEEIAMAIAEATSKWRRGVWLVGLAGSGMLEVFRRVGFEVMAEGFADRAYETDGTLRSRTLPGALIVDAEEAANQAARLSDRVDTICIHSDTPGAAGIARVVRERLDAMGRMKK